MYRTCFNGNRLLSFACLPADRETSGKEETDKCFETCWNQSRKRRGYFLLFTAKKNFESKEKTMKFLFSASCLNSLKLINFLVVIGNNVGTEKFRE